MQASQAAIGTIAYIAFETRRLHEAMKPKNERFVPLEIMSPAQMTAPSSRTAMAS